VIFGVVFPPLAIVVCLTAWLLTLPEEILLGKYLFEITPPSDVTMDGKIFGFRPSLDRYGYRLRYWGCLVTGIYSIIGGFYRFFFIDFYFFYNMMVISFNVRLFYGWFF
jgi:hypothetical protein